MRWGKRDFPQLEQAETFLGFFAWCERREFFLALEVRLRGTAMLGSPLFF